MSQQRGPHQQGEPGPPPEEPGKRPQRTGEKRSARAMGSASESVAASGQVNRVLLADDVPPPAPEDEPPAKRPKIDEDIDAVGGFVPAYPVNSISEATRLVRSWGQMQAYDERIRSQVKAYLALHELDKKALPLPAELMALVKDDDFVVAGAEASEFAIVQSLVALGERRGAAVGAWRALPPIDAVSSASLAESGKTEVQQQAPSQGSDLVVVPVAGGEQKPAASTAKGGKQRKPHKGTYPHVCPRCAQVPPVLLSVANEHLERGGEKVFKTNGLHFRSNKDCPFYFMYPSDFHKFYIEWIRQNYSAKTADVISQQTGKFQNTAVEASDDEVKRVAQERFDTAQAHWKQEKAADLANLGKKARNFYTEFQKNQNDIKNQVIFRLKPSK
jgi:hypothetical protein